MKNTIESTILENKDRRNMLLGATAIAASLVTESSIAASGHKHVHHANKNTAIIDAALDCLKTGQACNDHCIELIKSGDTSIANCMDSLTESLAMCDALAQMASYQSSHLAAVTKVCISVCEDCEKECRKHEDDHAECKACADSCKDCIKACKEIA